ncbi:MAG: cupin domain-containing protein [Planctomycetaceae bacterium]
MSATTAKSEVFNVTGGLGCQDHAIVSRVLLKQRSGNVTLFAFDGGQELSEHTCPYEAFLHVLEGSAEVTIGGEPHSLAEHHAIVLPAGVPHAVRASEPFKMLLTIIRA